MNWAKKQFIPALFTIVFHMVIIAVAGMSWESRPELHREPPKLHTMTAKVVDMEQLMAPKRKREAERQEALRKAREEAERKKKQAEEKQKKLAEEKKKAAEEAAKKARTEKEKARKDKERKEQLKREQAKKEEQRKQQEREAKEAAAKAKQDAERKAAEAAKRDLAAALDKEEEFIESVEAASLVQSYLALINQAIVSNWTRPPSAKNGMETELQLQLIPTGEVISVSVRRSSGNAAFDRSAINAVNKAQPFTELRQLESRIFDANFRTFIIRFRPEDLRR